MCGSRVLRSRPAPLIWHGPCLICQFSVCFVMLCRVWNASLIIWEVWRVVFRADGEPHASQDGTAQTHSADPKRAIGISGNSQKNDVKLKVNTNPRFSYLRECSCFMLNTLLCVCAWRGVSNQNQRSWESLWQQGRVRWEQRVILIKLIPSKPQDDVISVSSLQVFVTLPGLSCEHKFQLLALSPLTGQSCRRRRRDEAQLHTEAISGQYCETDAQICGGGPLHSPRVLSLHLHLSSNHTVTMASLHVYERACVLGEISETATDHPWDQNIPINMRIFSRWLTHSS